MMSLFDEEQIMKSFVKSERHEEARETAERMIKDGYAAGITKNQQNIQAAV